MPDTLSLNEIKVALTGTGAAFRRRVRLQPAGGPGDKVFPPTYMGAVYAVENRRIDGEVKTCVVLDSVQSQANRMEEALQQAVDEGRLSLPLVVVDFGKIEGLLDEVGRVTSLEAPHRIVDAILRDSVVGDGTRFRESTVGAPLDQASVRNATPVYDLSPASLVFGMWDSHGRKGGLGAKFQRSLVSEIIGVGAEFGLRSGGRSDPLGIRLEAGPVYPSSPGNWTLEDREEGKKKSKKTGGKKPSEIGHGNVAPSFARYTSTERGLRDPLSAEYVRQGSPAPGGVTMEYGLQTTVLSLPALRRLRFPLDGKKPTPEVDAAARTVLTALGLCSGTLAGERGYDLRSRCVLWPEKEALWELLDRPGEEPRQFNLDGKTAIKILEEAVESTQAVGLRWREEPLVLHPSPQLVELLRRSQQLQAEGPLEEESEPEA